MLTVANLTKAIAGRTTIEDLRFSVGPGEKYCLFAPSGAGKSTLIHILSGLDKQFSGSVSVTARQRATVFQTPGLFGYKTVAENILYPLKLNRIVLNTEVRRQYEDWMALTKLKAFESYYPFEISGGMKQKAAIIRAFLPGPDLVLMDEPFKSMDMVGKREIMAHIRACCPDIALLLATHDPYEIPLMTDTVLVFKEPRLSNAYETLQVSVETGMQDLTSRLFGKI